MRGTGVDDLLDLCPGAFRILDDLVRPEPNDMPTLALHSCSSPRIGIHLESVMITIDLNHQLPCDTGEVCEVRANGMLAPELGAADTARPQQFPHLAFSTTAVATEFTCSHGIVIVSRHDPLT